VWHVKIPFWTLCCLFVLLCDIVVIADAQIIMVTWCQLQFNNTCVAEFSKSRIKISSVIWWREANSQFYRQLIMTFVWFIQKNLQYDPQILGCCEFYAMNLSLSRTSCVKALKAKIIFNTGILTTRVKNNNIIIIICCALVLSVFIYMDFVSHSNRMNDWMNISHDIMLKCWCMLMLLLVIWHLQT